VVTCLGLYYATELRFCAYSVCGCLYTDCHMTAEIKRQSYFRHYSVFANMYCSVICCFKSVDRLGFACGIFRDHAVYDEVAQFARTCSLLRAPFKYRLGQKSKLQNVTLTSAGQFSKSFRCHMFLEICNKVVNKYAKSPQTCRLLDFGFIRLYKSVTMSMCCR